MARLIDADALTEVLTAISSIRVDTGRAEEWAVTIGAARQAIAQMPTIEPKTGKWIKEYWNGEHTRKCSACNITQTVTTYKGKVNFNFCPYCGADMRD